MAEMDLGQLRPEFFEQIHTLRHKVINRIKPKTINGRKLKLERKLLLKHRIKTSTRKSDQKR